MDEARTMLNDPNLGPLLRNLTISKKKWSDLQAEIFEIGSSTTTAAARSALIEAGLSVLRYEQNHQHVDVSIQDADINKVLDFVRTEKTPRGDPRVYQFGTLLHFLFTKLSQEEDMPLLEQLSYLPFTPGFDVDKGKVENVWDELPDFVQFTVSENSSLNYLLLLKLMLIFLEKPTVGPSSDGRALPATALAELGVGAVLDAADIKVISEQISKLEQMRAFQTSPHPFPSAGSIMRCSKTEISGKTAGIVSGFSASQFLGVLLYFEVTITTKDRKAKNIRVGWGKSGMHIDGFTSLGAGPDSWVLDVGTGRFLHNSGIAEPPEHKPSSGEEEDSTADFSDGLFGGLFLEDDDTSATTAVEIDLAQALPISEPEPASSFGAALTDSGNYCHITSIKSGTTISCALELSSGKLSFYCNGVFMGHAPVSVDTESLAARSLVPVFSVGSAHSLEVNAGQFAFKQLRAAVGHRMSTEVGPTVDEITDSMSSQVSSSSCLELGQHNEQGAVQPGWLLFSNSTADGTKCHTIELCVLLNACPSPEAGTVLVDFSLVTCGPCLEEVSRACCPSDKGCQISVTSRGELCFEASGGEKVKTPANALPSGCWHHVSIVYTYHRSNDKATVQMYINGSSLVQADLVNKAGTKVGKLHPRHVLVSKPGENGSMKVCDFRLWSCSRSSDRVAACASRGKVFGAETDLLLWVPCEGASGKGVPIITGPNTSRRADSVPAQGAFRWCRVSEDKLALKTLSDVLNTSDLTSAQDQARTHAIHSLRSDNPSNAFVEIITAILAKFQVSSSKLLSVLSLGTASARKVLSLLMTTGISASVLSPTVPTFMLLCSVLRQLVASMNSHRIAADALHPIVTEVLLLVLKSNIKALQLMPDAWAAKNESVFAAVKSSLFVVLICLINGCKNVPPVQMEGLREVSLDILCDQLSFFVTVVENRYKMLEILLQAQSSDIHDIKIPQLKRAVSNFRADASYLQQAQIPVDCVRALLSLNSVAAIRLIERLSLHLSSRSSLRQYIPGFLLPRTSGTSIVRARTVGATPFPGVCVKRGPDWRLGDEDGGDGCLGVVINVFDWKSQRKTGLLVAWKNGTIDAYRFGVQETLIVDGNPTTKSMFDVELLTDELRVNSTSKSPSAEAGSGQEETFVTKRELQFSPTQVMNELLTAEGSGTLTRRSVLQYIKDMSTSEWQSKKKITKAVNVLLKDMSLMQLCSLYQDFHSTFSSKPAAELESLDKHFTSFDSHQADSGDRLSSFFTRLLQYVEQCVRKDTVHMQALRLLQAVQLSVLNDPGSVGDSGDASRPVLAYNSSEMNVEFMSEKKKFAWDWKLCRWSSVTEKQVEPVAKIAATGSVENRRETLLAMSVDDSKLNPAVHIRRRSHCVDATWTGSREWTTFITDAELAPNSGTHVWYVKLKHFSERKSSIMIGLASKAIDADQCLGQFDQGYGLSQSFDYFHAAQKQKIVANAPKMSSGSVIQVTYDSNKPSLRYVLLHDDEVYCREIGLDIAASMNSRSLYPAFSFFSPGDSISIVQDAEESSYFEARIAAQLAELEHEGLETASRPLPMFLGAPNTVVVHYVLAYCQMATRLLQGARPLHGAVEGIVGGLIHLLASLSVYSVAPTEQADKLLQEFMGLLSLLQTQMNRSVCADQPVRSVDGRLHLICAYNQVCALMVINMNKLVHVMTRHDQCVAWNYVLDGCLAKASFLSAFGKAKHSMLQASKSKLFRNGVRSGHSAIDSITSTIPEKGSNFEKLVQWLSAHCRLHRNLRTFGGEALDSVIHLAFACIIHHCGLSSIVLRTQAFLASFLQTHSVGDFAAAMKALKPPAYLVTCMECALSFRLWARDLIASTSGIGSSTYERIGQEATEKCTVLLGFESCYEDRNTDRMEDNIGDWLVHLQTDSKLSHHVEKAVRDVCVAFKTALHDIEFMYPIVAICKEMTNVAARRRDAFRHIRVILETLSEDLGCGLKLLFVDQLRKVLKGKKLALSSLITEGADMMSELRASRSSWHYLTGLESASKPQIAEVRAAVNAILSTLVGELSSNSERGSEYQLVLMDALAVRVEDFDHELLARTNIFFAIQELLDELVGKGKSIEGASCKQIVSQAMKLFIFLGLQVASANSPADSNTRVSIDDRSIPLLELRKVKSGPATLSKAVFDIVYVLLKDITDAIMSRCVAPDLEPLAGNEENVVVATEAISLLLCAAKSTECTSILNKPKWLHLMLDMCCYGMGQCRSRALQLLGDLLPGVDGLGLSWTCQLRAEVTSEFQLYGSSPQERIVAGLLFLIGDATLSEDSKPPVLRCGQSIVDGQCTAIVAEGVALVRKLINAPAWCSSTSRVIKSALQKFTVMLARNEWNSVGCKLTLASLFVLGGKFDGLHKGCFVVFKPSTSDGFHIGVIQAYVEGSTDLVEVVSFNLAETVFRDPSCETEVATSTAVLSTQFMQPVDAFHYVTLPKEAEELWPLVVGITGEFLVNGALITDICDQSEAKSHMFFFHVIKAAALKCAVNLAMNPTTNLTTTFVGAFGCTAALQAFLLKLLAKANKPSVFGGLNELPTYERHLDSLLRYLNRMECRDTTGAPSVVTSERIRAHESVARTSQPAAVAHSDEDEEVHHSAEEEVGEEDEDEAEDEDEEERGVDSTVADELVSMGFSRDVALLALGACAGDPEEALNYILNNGSALEQMVRIRELRGRGNDPRPSHLPSEGERHSAESEIRFHHYDGDRSKLLPLYTKPSFEAERIGCVFPGDDLSVLEECRVAGTTWFKLLYSDFDDGTMQSSFAEEMQNVFVWVPQTVNGVEVVRPGSYEGEGDGDLTDPPADVIAIDKYYRIIGVNGATVRTGREVSSAEVCLINTGEFVHAYLETINFDGTLRLQVDYPVIGWISKNLGLVEKVEPSPDLVERVAASRGGKPSLTPTDHTECNEHVRKLLDLEDSMEVLTGVDAFSKDDRFFGQMQGMVHIPFSSRSKRILMAKPSKLGVLKSTMDSATSPVASVKEDRYHLIITPLLRLLYRKLLLVLVLRSTGPVIAELDGSPGPAPSILALLMERGHAEGQWDSLAEHVVTFIRLIIFRGDPNIAYGVELCFYEGLAQYAMQPSDLCIEDVTFQSFVTLCRALGQKSELTPLVRAIESKLVLAIASSLALACAQKFSDHSWADTSYADDGDEEVQNQPNMHFVLWVVNVFIYCRNVSGLMSCVQYLLLALKSSSISLKCMLLRALGSIFRFARMELATKEDMECLEGMLSKVPHRRLMKFAAKRMRQEMEDSPAYSRFLQALWTFLGEFLMASKLVNFPVEDVDALPYHPMTLDRNVLRFSSKSSHIKILPGKDLSSSWTVETWLCRDEKDMAEHDTDTEKAAQRSGSNTPVSVTRTGFTGLLHMLLGTARQNIASRASTDSEAIEAKEEEASVSKEGAVPSKKLKFLRPSYLLQSSKYFIKLQKGGRIFQAEDIDDPLQGQEPVPSDSYCVSIGQCSSDVEKSFDCVVPVGRWLHLAMVHDSNLGVMSVYIDGKLADAQPLSMALPLGTVGSSMGQESFLGDMAELRVWTHARTELEIKRDMFLDVRKCCSAHLALSAWVEDSKGYFGACTAVECVLAPIETSRVSSQHVAAIGAQFATEHVVTPLDCTVHKEYTGIVRINCAGRKGPLANGLHEIVTLSLSPEVSQSCGEFDGVLEWCDRGIKMAIRGELFEDRKLTFTYCSQDTAATPMGNILKGPPEKLLWLQQLVFKGTLLDDAVEGTVDCVVSVDSVAPPPPGKARLDPSRSSARIHCKDDRIFLDDGDEGQYVAIYEIAPHCDRVHSLSNDLQDSNVILTDDLPWGLLKDQGSVWIEFAIDHNSGNIAFGMCTYDALSHPDASVDANDGTFTYNTAGTVSHGSDLDMSDHADSGDIISIHVDTAGATIYIFKNYRVVAVFEDIFRDSVTAQERSTQGLRPFVSLASAGDCVRMLPMSNGIRELMYQEGDARQRQRFVCCVNEGDFTGMGATVLVDGTCWFGEYAGAPRGVHILVEDSFDVKVVRAQTFFANGRAEDGASEEEVIAMVQEFILFRAQHLGSARAETHQDIPRAEGEHISINIQTADNAVSAYAIVVTAPLRIICETHASRLKIPLSALRFLRDEVALDINASAQELGLVNDATIQLRARRVNLGTVQCDDVVEQFFPHSTAMAILQIVYEPGATVRSSIEIEGSAALYTMPHKEVVEVFAVAHTSEGIKRYRTGDGWISDKLRGGTEARVVRFLQERQVDPLPIYKVVRSDGIKGRTEASMKSAECGFIPALTLLLVDEKRVVADGGSDMAAGDVTRLHVASPAEFAGWISDKPHLVQAVSADGSPLSTGEKAAAALEASRRAKVRLLRKTKQALLQSEKRFVRKMSVTGTLSASQETFFLWKKSRVLEQQSVSISEDRRTVRATESFSGGRLLVVGSRALTTGVHYWEVRVQSAAWGSVFIGVTPLPDASSGGWQGLGFINYRATQSFGHESIYGSYFSAGDTVGVLLDLNKGFVGFFKHGEDFNLGKVVYVNMGIAYRCIYRLSSRFVQSSTFYPCVGIKSPGDQVTIEHSHWQSERGLGIRQQLDEYVHAYTCMSIWEESYHLRARGRGDPQSPEPHDLKLSHFHELPPAVLSRVFQAYLYKSHTQEVSRQSRPGFVVNFTKSMASPKASQLAVKYHFGVGSKLVQTFATGGQQAIFIQGSSGQRIWYSTEASGQKAWYWTVQELEEHLRDGVVVVDANYAAPEQIEGPASPTIATSQQAFIAALHAPWSAEEDCFLTQQLNSCSRALDLSPMQVTYALFHEMFDGARERGEAVALGQHTTCEINVRIALLCELNACATQVLPFIDMGDAEARNAFFRFDPQFSSPQPRGSAAAAVAATAVRAISTRSPAGRNLYPLTSPARMVYQHIKWSIFTSTKHAYWTNVLEETTHLTNAPPDEYERPEEIREVNINRVQAQHVYRQYVHQGKTSALSLPARLRTSVVGQLQAALEAWESRTFRRAYVHMQDAGQRRAFFVKFSGEGVDDQGGPYRALFQNSAEEARHLLHLLEPCANAAAEVGLFRDKALFNPNVHSAVYKKLYVFFGKLAALAVRHRIHMPLDFAPYLWKGIAGEEVHVEDAQAVDTALSSSLQLLLGAADSIGSSVSSGEEIVGYQELFLQALAQAAQASRTLAPHVCEDIVQAAISGVLGFGLPDVVRLVFGLHVQSQCEPLRGFLHGLAASVPVELLSIFTAEEADRLFCGEAKLDIAMLQRVCVYEDCTPSDAHVKLFWAALAALGVEEQAMFVNFCSGRARLPESLLDCMPFKLTPLLTEGDADKYLPTARTCFFTLALPKYSSLEVCLEKLRYAIRNTELMDADFIDRRGATGWDNLG